MQGCGMSGQVIATSAHGEYFQRLRSCKCYRGELSHSYRPSRWNFFSLVLLQMLALVRLLDVKLS
jgi:hypothetical protein